MRRLWMCLLLGVLSFAAAQDAGHDMGKMSMEMEGGLATLEGDAFEIAFLSMMIAHHEGAVEMAEWILERSSAPGVWVAAQEILAAQGREIALMEGWLKGWYGQGDEEATDAMREEMITMMEEMLSGDDADRAFLQGMSAHHNSAIDMAQLALVRATHPRLRELAERIIQNQAQEIAQYQGLLEQ